MSQNVYFGNISLRCEFDLAKHISEKVIINYSIISVVQGICMHIGMCVCMYICMPVCINLPYKNMLSSSHWVFGELQIWLKKWKKINLIRQERKVLYHLKQWQIALEQLSNAPGFHSSNNSSTETSKVWWIITHHLLYKMLLLLEPKLPSSK